METILSARLRELRKSQGLSAHDLVKKLKKYDNDYSLQSVYKWENGFATPNLAVIKSLSKILHCHISYLIEERNVEYKNLTPSEIFLLHLYQEDFLFRSIATQIMTRFERNSIN